MRYYSECKNPFGPPRDLEYGIGENGEPIRLPRDTRMWMSIEWAKERGIPVPNNWKDYR